MVSTLTWIISHWRWNSW